MCAPLFTLARTEREIYSRFAPLTPTTSDSTRPSWYRRPRKIKRDMLAASLRRLVAAGKIRLASEEPYDDKSMHGMVRQNRKTLVHLFGGAWDGKLRTYAGTNALQAIADALLKEDA